MEKTKKETAEAVEVLEQDPITKATGAALKAPTLESSLALYEAIMQPVNAGRINPLKALAELAALEKAITQAKKDVNEFFAQGVMEKYMKERENDTTLSDKERESKQLELYGSLFLYKQLPTRYDLTKYVDKKTGEVVENTAYIKLSDKLKKMEAKLKIDGKVTARPGGMSVSVILQKAKEDKPVKA